MALALPAEPAVDVVLRDGTSVRLRTPRAEDAPAMRALLEKLDSRDRLLRFFTAAPNLDAAARWAVDRQPDRFGIVAVAGDDRTILAHGCAVRSEPGEAEVAFAVDPRLRKAGIATTMLAHLAELAGAGGVDRLTAVVLPENRAMLDVFRESGLQPTIRWHDGELHLAMPTALGPAARERYDRRDAEAAAAAVEHVLRPRSVAVLGASDRAGSVGGAVLRNLIAAGYTGALHAVNRRGGTVAGLPANRSLDAIGAPVETVVVAIPAEGVAAEAEACGRLGVRALVVLSDGFAESGEAGRRRQQELLAICRRDGMRLVGPNCLGVLNTDPAIRLDATFAPHQPPAGRVAFLSQSGALGIAVIDAARELGLGLSSFVSIGDKADLSGNDFLSYWEADPNTDVVLLYLESFGNPRRFSRVARRVGACKPIIAVKGGRSAAGAHAAGSHTGALLAASDTTVQALFRQAGVIPTDTLGELFDVAAFLAVQPAPRGRRVGIVTNGGGLGILCADACAALGLDVVALPSEAQAILAAGLRTGAAVGNPVDLLAAASPQDYEHAIDGLDVSGGVDAVIAIYVPPMVSDPVEVVAAIQRAANRATMPIASVLTMAEPPLASLAPGGSRVPAYRFPENAARAIARAAGYGIWRDREAEDPPAQLKVDVARAARVLNGALHRGPGWLAPAELAELLDAYGISHPPQRSVASPREAGEAARALATPVALKAIAHGLVHRTDADAVRLGLGSPSAVVREARAMRSRLARVGIEVTGFLVQAMAEDGVELLAGVVSDPTFGPVVACAAGGTNAELLADTAVRLTPLGPRAADEMIRSLHAFPLLDGFRGAARCDVAALAEVLVRLSVMADAHPEIAELECNPVIAGPHGAVAVDARARVELPPPFRPEPALRPA
ncbi:MAG: family N-acetyltransferase [Conexibacter sp.]|nr:family N-acetyltransferase [Conexibacter sp.]